MINFQQQFSIEPTDGGQAETNIRPLYASDDLPALTRMLHRAYKQLGDSGLNFTAVNQSVETTVQRIARGQCFVVETSDRIIGTVMVSRPDRNSLCPLYRRPEVAIANQFAVDPACQDKGIGTCLMSFSEAWAWSQGYVTMAVDTAEPAHNLLRFYTSRGYRTIDHVQWQGKVYRSLVLQKTLTGMVGN